MVAEREGDADISLKANGCQVDYGRHPTENVVAQPYSVQNLAKIPFGAYKLQSKGNEANTSIDNFIIPQFFSRTGHYILDNYESHIQR